MPVGECPFKNPGVGQAPQFQFWQQHPVSCRRLLEKPGLRTGQQAVLPKPTGQEERVKVSGAALGSPKGCHLGRALCTHSPQSPQEWDEGNMGELTGTSPGTSQRD